MTKTGGHFSLH